MKKLFNFFKGFIIKHFKLSMLIVLVTLTVSLYVSIKLYSEVFAFLSIFASGFAVFRLITFKKGHIPFAGDSLYYRIKRQCKKNDIFDYEDIDDKYKEVSLRHAAFFFTLNAITFPVLLIIETTIAIVNLCMK